MQAVVLAAGVGRRMAVPGHDGPKGLLEVGGTTIVARLVAELEALGADPITVVVGHRADDVRAALRATNPHAPLAFVANPRHAADGNVVSLALALEVLVAAGRSDPLLLVEGDLVLAPGLLGRLAADPDRSACLVDRHRPGLEGTVAEVEAGLVRRLVAPAAQPAGFRAAGTFKTVNAYHLTTALWRDALAARSPAHVAADPAAYHEEVLAGLGDLGPWRIAAVPVDGEPWAEVDDPVDLARARFAFEPDGRARRLDALRGGHWGLGVLDFAHMANRRFPPEALLDVLRHELGDLTAGYGSRQAVVDEKLGWLLGCPGSRLRALNGATQAYPILRELWAGRSAAIPSPSFGEYAATFPAALRYADAPGLDLAALDALAGRVEVLVVVTPNSPTGTVLPTAELLALARRHPATTLLVDESFQAFSDQPTVRAALEADGPANVVVLCSLSKALGVPGLRIGYLYARDADLLAAVGDRLPVWGLSAPAERFLELCLKHRPALDASLAQTVADRAALRKALGGVAGVRVVHPSGGDFLLVDLDGPRDLAASVRDALLAAHRIEVRVVTDRWPGGPPRLRVGVRLPEDNRRLVDALGQALAG